MIKILIVEDDMTSSLLMQELLKPYGIPRVAVNGKQAVDAVRLALETGEPYNLICLDIMMPKLDGHAALKQIRGLEEAQGICSSNGAKIVMTTALNNMKSVNEAFDGLCDAYLVKPIGKNKVLETLRQLKLIQ